jgi:hypothetical protein
LFTGTRSENALDCVNKGRFGPPRRPATQPCGTAAAYKRHIYHGEEPCEACREANRTADREKYHRRRANGGA